MLMNYSMHWHTMPLETPSFIHEFAPGSIHYGRGCIADLGETLSVRGCENALVVCGRNVGSNEDLMTPVKEGLGPLLGDVFDSTTPQKSLETVFAGVERMEETEADVLVAVGGGSSLDVATGMSMLARDDRTIEDARSEVLETGVLALPDEEIVPVVPVPTTLAGADLSVAAGLVVPTEEENVEAIVADNRLMPEALFYDPDLFETTPMDALAGSAINGFDKGIEAVYSRFANPLTDSTAVRGLKYLRSSLPELRTGSDPAIMDRAVMGIILVQYGVSIPNAYKINIVHAFGHALRNEFGIQQGIAHAIIVPHALRLIFEEGGGRPDVLAEGLVTDPESEVDNVEDAVVDAVVDVRDGLELPKRLRDVEGTSKDGLRSAAKHTYEDDFLNIGPPEFDPTVDAIEAVLREAW